MLGARDRSLLLESLRPPEGFHVDLVVATSYTLDLVALLTAPLAFTLQSWEDKGGNVTTDPIAFLQAVRTHARRISLFCQAGEIDAPRPNQRLISYMEEAVWEVAAPSPGGLFHPKIWSIRYVADDGVIRYRLLCLSRNLTFDRSWDTVLRLDGELTKRTRPIASHRSLSDFVTSLPELTIRRMPKERRGSIELMADELLRVEFECPDDVKEYVFHPLGHRAGLKSDPFPRKLRRFMVVSPFVSGTFLRGIAERLPSGSGPPNILVGRAEELEKIPAQSFAAFGDVKTIAETMDPEAEDAQGHAAAPIPSARGLHAKLFVHDDGSDSSVWTGSANATDAAFGQNVEFLVELRGKKSKLGIDCFLNEKDGFGAILTPWSAPEMPAEVDARREAMERELNDAARRLATASLSLAISSADEPLLHHVRLVRDPGSHPIGISRQITARAWLASLSSTMAAPVDFASDCLSELPPVTRERLTTFVVVEICIVEHIAVSKLFTLNLPATDMPGDRDELLLVQVLQDREGVLRILQLLLAGEEGSADDLASAAAGATAGSFRGTYVGHPLLESLLRALHSAPRRLEEIDRLVADLLRTEKGRALMPEGLESIWAPVREAWLVMRGERRAVPPGDAP